MFFEPGAIQRTRRDHQLRVETGSRQLGRQAVAEEAQRDLALFRQAVDGLQHDFLGDVDLAPAVELLAHGTRRIEDQFHHRRGRRDALDAARGYFEHPATKAEAGGESVFGFTAQILRDNVVKPAQFIRVFGEKLPAVRGHREVFEGASWRSAGAG